MTLTEGAAHESCVMCVCVCLYFELCAVCVCTPDLVCVVSVTAKNGGSE